MRQKAVDRIFTYHKPTEEEVQLMTEVRNQAKILFELVNLRAPENREKLIAVQKLEEFVMWTNAGIVRSGQDD